MQKSRFGWCTQKYSKENQKQTMNILKQFYVKDMILFSWTFFFFFFKLIFFFFCYFFFFFFFFFFCFLIRNFNSFCSSFNYCNWPENSHHHAYSRHHANKEWSIFPTTTLIPDNTSIWEGRVITLYHKDHRSVTKLISDRSSL